MNKRASVMLARKNRSSDENSKGMEKHKEFKRSKRPANHGSREKIQPMDMKSVKVLVERTKFNEMEKTTPHKLVNGGGKGAMEKNKRNRPKSQKNVLPLSASHKTHIDELFRIRKCYVKISKDKLLIGQLSKMDTPLKRTRGRPKKDFIGGKEESLSPPSSTLKRKTIEDDDASPPKRKPKPAKGAGFFINICALTRTPSPRRKNSPQKDTSEEAKRKVKKPTVKKPTTNNKVNTTPTKHLSAIALRHKFGNRYFKSFVKVKRLREGYSREVPKSPPKKKKGKNLSVSFLETVEIFGESSDSEDWIDGDEATPSPVKTTRSKRLENCDNSSKAFCTSTPSGGDASPTATSTARKGGILKRKEKISFSPLKEDESSPRKEQLKRANEKIVRLSFEQPPVDDDEPAPPEEHQETSIGKKKCDDDDKRLSLSVENLSVTPVSPEAEMITPPSSAKKNDKSAEQENFPTQVDGKSVAEKQAHAEEEREAEGQETEKEKDHSLEGDTTPADKPLEEENSPSAPGKDIIDNDLFLSADTLTMEVTAASPFEDETKPDEFLEELKLSGTDVEDEPGSSQKDRPTENVAADDTEDQQQPVLRSAIEEEEEKEVEAEKKLAQEKPAILGSSQDNTSNTSNSSDQHFEDASELVASALLSESIEEDRNEAEAVLNDVCQIAAAESDALLSDVNYESEPPPTENVVGDDDDDFRSVLTHPEVERSLQSAASNLVPNSQEIAVAAAAASQAVIISPADVIDDTFASVVAEVERFTKDVSPEIYSDEVGITGADVMMDNVQASNSLDDIFDDDDVDGQSHMFLHFPDDIISSLRMSSANIDIGHDKSLPIQVIETEVMAIPNEPDLIFDKALGTTASILGTSMSAANDTHEHSSTGDTGSRMSLGRLFQSVKSYVMSPGGVDHKAAFKD